MTHLGRKLGRYKSGKDSRDLLLANYTQNVPDPPSRVNWAARIKTWAMMLNDRYGCCVIAGKGHLIQVWTYNAKGKRATITNAAILADYENVSGFVPGDEATDIGCNIRDMLKLWLKKPLMGHPLAAFARVDVPPNYAHSKTFRQAHWLFGGLLLGFDLPLSAQKQTENGEPWSVTASTDSKPGSWGGHCVLLTAVSSEGLEVLSWGEKITVTWPFLATYASEAWAGISSDWLLNDTSPSGFNLEALEADLKALRAA